MQTQTPFCDEVVAKSTVCSSTNPKGNWFYFFEPLPYSKLSNYQAPHFRGFFGGILQAVPIANTVRAETKEGK
jgi:hypothetical protein